MIDLTKKRKRKIKVKIKGVIDYYYYYKFYTKYYKKPQAPEILYRQILKDFNLKLKDCLINDAEKVKMPIKTGVLYVKKYDRVFFWNRKKEWKVNWKESREKGYKVYFTEQPYLYKFVWKNSNKYYWFMPCRTMSRDLAKAILVNKKDYFR